MSENQLYFAPMEGITGSIYRRAHHRIFGGVDRYYAPFIFTNPKGKISKKDLLEIAPEYNEGCRVVPQLLSNCAEDFIATAHTLKEMGYDEVNLNLGCPSSTVASKGRGSGFLGEKEALKAFLADIFEKTENPIEFWYTQELQLSKCTRVFQETKEIHKTLVHLRASCTKVYQSFSKIQRIP